MPAILPEDLQKPEIREWLMKEAALAQAEEDAKFERILHNNPGGVTIAPRNITVTTWDPNDPQMKYTGVFMGQSKFLNPDGTFKIG